MLFNSFGFIFFFLPITLFVFYLICKRNHHRVAISWLVFCSLFFYGWWNPVYLLLMLFSILFNYTYGVMLGSKKNDFVRKNILIIGVGVNLSLLGYFKYANFFIDQINYIFDSSYTIDNIILPLAISFFTFQQIAYLVDAYRFETKEYNFLHYCLFVTFFPQLIAGPIVHHKEMLPQFSKESVYKFNYEHISIGLIIFLRLDYLRKLLSQMVWWIMLLLFLMPLRQVIC
jgi:D-alanyl-lipoteichoic acid acyltransferase DltB (MBOAT superfamily)